MPQVSPVVPLDASPVLTTSLVVDVVLVLLVLESTASAVTPALVPVSSVVVVVVVVDATPVPDAEAEVVGVDPLLLCPTGAVPQNPSLQLSSVPQSLSPLQGCPSRNLPLKQAPSASAPTK